MKFRGTKHDDDLNGTTGNDVFNMTRGGDDTVHAGDGNDVIWMGAKLTAADRIDGGAGDDKITLSGDYSSGLVFDADTFTSIERLFLKAGHDYNFTMNDANVAADERLTINAHGLKAANSLTFDGSAEMDGRFVINAGAGDDTLTGGHKADIFDLSKGGDDTALGGDGNDQFDLGAKLTAADRIDGGAGLDTLSLNGNYNNLVLGADTIRNVEMLELAANRNYAITTNEATVAAGATLTVDASALDINHSLALDARAETDGKFVIKGGAGSDVVKLSVAAAAGSSFDGGAYFNQLLLTGSGNSALTLSDAHYQHIGNFALAGDNFDLTFDGDLNADDGYITVQAWDVSGDIKADFSAATTDRIAFLGGAGDDTVIFSADKANWSYVDGDAGDNHFQLYDTAGGVIDGAQVKHFDTVDFLGSFDYSDIAIVGNISSTGSLTVNAGDADSLSLDASGITTAHFQLNGSGGDDTFVLGTNYTKASVNGQAGSDTLVFQDVAAIDLYNGQFYQVDKVAFADGTGAVALNLHGNFGNDGLSVTVDGSNSSGLTLDLTDNSNNATHVIGGSGDDFVNFGATFDAGDSVDGGGGDDTVQIGASDDFVDVDLDATVLANVGTLKLADGAFYELNFSGDLAAAQGTFTLDAGALTGSNAVEADFTAATMDRIDFKAGTGGVSVLSFDAQKENWGDIDGGDARTQIHFYGDTSGFEISSADFHHVNYLFFEGDDIDVTGITVTGDIVGDDGYLYVNARVGSGGTFQADLSTLANDMTVDGEAASYDVKTGSGSDSLFMDSATLAVTASAGDGDDFISFSHLAAGTHVDGGQGHDWFIYDFHGTDSVTLQSGMLDNVEEFFANRGTGGVSASFTIGSDTLDAGETLRVSTSALTGSQFVKFDGSGETNGSFAFAGGTGNEIFIANGNAATFDMSQGGNDRATGGAGDDTFTFGSAFTNSDVIDGGAGYDTLSFTGAGKLGSLGMSVLNVEKFVLGGACNFGLNDATVAAGKVLAIDGTAATNVSIDATAETNGGIAFTGGAGGDNLVLGSSTVAGFSSFDGGAGTDSINLANSISNVVLASPAFTNIESIVFVGGNYSSIRIVGDITGGGGLLGVTASSAISLSLNLRSATTAGYNILGSFGSDTFTFAGNLHASDTINGYVGFDTLQIGQLSGVTLSGAKITDVEKLTFTDGANDSFAVSGNISGSSSLTIDTTSVGNGLTVSADLSAATSSSIAYLGGAAADTVTFSLARHNWGSVDGGGGNNTFALAGGGVSNLNGGSGALQNFDTLKLNAGGDYNLFLFGDMGHSGALKIDASALTTESLTVDLSGATTAGIAVTGGGGDDSVFVGQDNLTAFDGGAGIDTLGFTGSSGTYTLDGSAMKNLESIFFGEGDYDLRVVGDITTGGGALMIDGNAFANSLTLDLTDATTAAIKVFGSSGDDVVTLGDPSHVTQLYLGLGNDTVIFAGGGTVTGSAIQDVETFEIRDGDYSSALKILGHINAGASTLMLDGSASTGGVSLDLSATTNASIAFTGGSGNDTVSFSQASFFAASVFDGGDGANTVEIGQRDGAAFALSDAIFRDVDAFVFSDGADLAVTVDGNVGHNGVLTLDASALTLGYHATIDASGSDAPVIIIGGMDADTFTGNTGPYPQGSTLFSYTDVGQSTGATHDIITNLDFNADGIGVSGIGTVPTGIDAAVTTGGISLATFDGDLAAVIDGTALGAHHALLFTADGGDLAGHTFLVVDVDGNAGYQAGQDLVIDITGYSGALSTGNFI
ncbi:MAG TPA: bluetail domain-containing putative surface protein [Rhizomicrobium sp.]|nr:bluetail domain-containing putative surface protein [Rhizomicrobium sp.]